MKERCWRRLECKVPHLYVTESILHTHTHSQVFQLVLFPSPDSCNRNNLFLSLIFIRPLLLAVFRRNADHSPHHDLFDLSLFLLCSGFVYEASTRQSAPVIPQRVTDTPLSMYISYWRRRLQFCYHQSPPGFSFCSRNFISQFLLGDQFLFRMTWQFCVLTFALL